MQEKFTANFYLTCAETDYHGCSMECKIFSTLKVFHENNNLFRDLNFSKCIIFYTLNSFYFFLECVKD